MNTTYGYKGEPCLLCGEPDDNTYSHLTYGICDKCYMVAADDMLGKGTPRFDRDINMICQAVIIRHYEQLRRNLE